MSIPQRPLGGSGMTVSEIGFDSGALATPPAVSDPGPVVHAALDAGITFFDAVPYGDGDGEAVLARALRGEHRRVVVAARCLAVDHPVWGPDPRAWRPEIVRLRMEQALRRLGRDWLDLWQLERPSREAVEDEDLWASLLAARARGWIRSIGIISDAKGPLTAVDDETDETVTRFPVELDAAVAGLVPADAVSVRFGLLDPALGRLLTGQAAIADGRLALLGRDPLDGVDGSGPADRLVGDFVFPTVDRTRHQAALAGVLSTPALTTALISPATPAQAGELATASAVPLSPAERAELEGRWDELDPAG